MIYSSFCDGKATVLFCERVECSAMNLVYLTFIFYSGINFLKSEDIDLDISQVELRLLLSVTSKPGLETPNEDAWRDWDIQYVGHSLRDGLELFRLPQYNRSLPTIVFVHGLLGSAVRHSLPMIAMLNHGYRERFNLISVNIPYFKFSSSFPFYRVPAIYTKMLGEEIGKVLKETAEQGLITQGQIHLAGFSLGAQCSGFIARAAGGLVATVVGLDPAGPGFNSRWGRLYELTHISKSDAPVVIVYHTNSPTLGTTKRIAKADVVFNGGWLQPGCKRSKIIQCSHKRALHIFAEVIRKPGSFEAIRCNSHKEFQSCKCHASDNQEVMNLTFPPDSKADGKYYLTTAASTSSLGKGHDGILCPEMKEEVNNIVPYPSKLSTFKRMTSNMSEHKELLAESTTQPKADFGEKERKQTDTEKGAKRKPPSTFIEKYTPDHTTVAKLKNLTPSWFPFKNKLMGGSTTQKAVEFDQSIEKHGKFEVEKSNYNLLWILNLNPFKNSKLASSSITDVKDLYKTSSETKTEELSDYLEEGRLGLSQSMNRQSYKGDSSELDKKLVNTEILEDGSSF